MKIVDIKYISTIYPISSSGTGHSQPDKFEITFDNGYKVVTLIDCWYRTDDRRVFDDEMYNLYQRDMNIDSIDNLFDAYQMYKTEKTLNKV